MTREERIEFMHMLRELQHEAYEGVTDWLEEREKVMKAIEKYALSEREQGYEDGYWNGHDDGADDDA